jgi:putative SOS response-associated peptidase YedK
MRPTDVVPVIAPNRHGERAVFPMKWGFSGKTLLINARSETAAVKPTFKEAWQRHRCIIPASWYFEWEHRIGNDGRKYTGDKYMLQPRGSSVTWLCGLYRIEEGLPVFVVLTREPGEEIRFLHDRMPLILPQDLVGEWIRPGANPEELVQEALTDMMFEKAV